MTLNPQVYFRAAELIETVGWTQGILAVGAKGYSAGYADPEAKCFCMLGAVYRASHDLKVSGLDHWHRLCEMFPQPVHWNDAKGREAHEVSAKLREIGGQVACECAD